MNIFKTLRLKWWQTVLFKICILSFGIAIGSVWPEAFMPIALPLFAVSVVTGGYLWYVWYKLPNRG